MTPELIGQELAERSYAALSSRGLKSAWYPAPGTLPVLPTLIITWDRIDVAELNEQINTLRFKGLLFTSFDPVETQIATVDPLVMPLIDAFSANANSSNHRLTSIASPGIAYVSVTSAELSIPIVYNGQTHYGGRIWWDAKVRRFAGET
jgi:hypothetical protein